MPVAIRRTRFEDFEALANLTPDNQTDVVQLGAGRMTGDLTHLMFDPLFSISTGSFSLGVRAAGVLSDTRWSLGCLFRSDGKVLGRQMFGTGDITFAAPGEERFAKLQNNTRFATTLIHPAAIQTFLGSSPGAYDEIDRLRIAVMPRAASSPDIGHLRRLLKEIVQDGPRLGDDVLAFHQRNILEILTAPIRDATRYRGSYPPASGKLARDIDHYLISTDTRPVHISELCERFGVTRRTLHRVFDDVMGIAPITFLRHKRLGDVHAALKRDGPGVTVEQIARDHGFLHLSRFAAQYRQLFGERPSATLGRR
jgi:AraC family ethanolamine operon transcriptional activator